MTVIELLKAIMMGIGLLATGLIGLIIVMLIILWCSGGTLNKAEGWHKRNLKTMFYCTRCGSTNVEGHCYVGLNTLMVEEYPQFDLKGPLWCNDCQDNCTVTEDPDEYKEWDEANKGDEIRDLKKEEK